LAGKTKIGKIQSKEKLKCLTCGQDKDQREFYVSNSQLNAATGRLPYCRECLVNMVTDQSGNLDMENFKKVLERIDKPFIYNVLQSSFSEGKKNNTNPITLYFKNINSLPQYKKMTWKDSVFLSETNKTQENQNMEITNDNTDFIVTKEMIIKWGNGFSKEQYMMLEDLYQNLFRSYDIEHRSQEEYLKTACLYQLRNIEAIRLGNAAEAQKWGGLFDSYMASGKLKPNQLSESDKMGGVTNFATFFQYIEKSNDFIPTFPDLIIDDIDYAIYMFINYNRQLMGLPEIQLGEVKNFMTYDYQKGQEIIFPPLNIRDGNDEDNGIQ
jgi:hypothetical protein